MYDEKAGLLRKLLEEFSFVQSIEEDPSPNAVPSLESAVERIKHIQEEIRAKNLFQDITDPSEWQREIRKEWDRDF